MSRVPCPVLFNRSEVPGVWRLGLAFDALARDARAARFLMLSVEGADDQVIPRPFSISDVYRRDDGTVVTEILYKPIGRTTRRMSALRECDGVTLTGLFGNGFPLPHPEAKPVLLAGGIGNAPFAYQCRELVEQGGRKASDILLLLAARSSDDLYIQPIVRDLGVEVVEITEDGSRGEKGRITDALERRLPQLGRIEGFACGPEPMLHALQEMALRNGFPCHLSVEERMACGYGVCNACVVEERRDGVAQGTGWYRRACIDGPVFEAKEIHA